VALERGRGRSDLFDIVSAGLARARGGEEPPPAEVMAATDAIASCRGSPMYRESDFRFQDETDGHNFSAHAGFSQRDLNEVRRMVIMDQADKLAEEGLAIGSPLMERIERAKQRWPFSP
jgi:hypothetical protein